MMFYSKINCKCFKIFFYFQSSSLSRFHLGSSTSELGFGLHILPTFTPKLGRNDPGRNGPAETTRIRPRKVGSNATFSRDTTLTYCNKGKQKEDRFWSKIDCRLLKLGKVCHYLFTCEPSIRIIDHCYSRKFKHGAGFICLLT